MVKPKKQSKRVPLARRYNIHKKAKEHERKERRNARKNPNMRMKLKKDPGIPNMNPFKTQLLAKAVAAAQTLKTAERIRARRAQEIALRMKMGLPTDEMSVLLADAASRVAAFDSSAPDDAAAHDGTRQTSNAKAGEQTRRAFYRHVRALVEKADIILEVLDARDPLSCRAPAVEALALAHQPPKRVILVLNKIDLVPPEVVQQWLAYLRREFPTVAFKATTQQQRTHLSAPGGAAINKATEAGEVLTGAGAAGADTLLQLIKNYSRNHDLKSAVTVGVIGYPNVGKSSIINSLKRTRAVGVSPTPGFTRTLQEVQLDSKVTVIDCPGVIFDDDAGTAAGEDAGAGLLLRNCISPDQIDDPEAAVHGILARCSPEKLMMLYKVPAFADPHEFLAHVAAQRGKLAKGGVPDRAAAARSVLQDWNSGRIPFFVLPPDDSAAKSADSDGDAAMGGAGAGAGAGAAADEVGGAAIVSEWSKEFDLEGLLKLEKESVLARLEPKESSGYLAVRSAKGAGKLTAHSKSATAAAARLLAETRDMDDEDDEDDEDEDEDDEDDDEDEDDEDDDEDDDDEEEEDGSMDDARRAGSSRGGAGAAGKAGARGGAGGPPPSKGGKGSADPAGGNKQRKSVSFAASGSATKSAAPAAKASSSSSGGGSGSSSSGSGSAKLTKSGKQAFDFDDMYV